MTTQKHSTKTSTRKKNRYTTLPKELFNSNARGIDKVLIFRFFRLLHGRFWGIGFILSGTISISVCYLINSSFLGYNIPLSNFGTDIRTAPYFAGGMFFAAYSLWRWRKYLSLTLKNPRPVIPLLSATILGCYLVALMPVTWEVWPQRLHYFGVALIGSSMIATVIFDSFLSKIHKSSNLGVWRLNKSLSLICIFFGSIITFLSLEKIAVLQHILIGEMSIFFGYTLWIITKIYAGEGPRSAIGRVVKKLFN